MSENLKHLSALTALNNMMRKGYLDICCIDSVGELLEVNVKCEAYQILRPLHCVHFDKMPKALADKIPELVQQCIGAEVIFTFTTATQTEILVAPPSEHTPQPKQNGSKLLRLFHR